MASDVLTLIAQTVGIDTYGNETVTETEKTVYCEVDSITQSEFYAAANTELNPEYRFTVFFGDYDGQKVIRYQDKRYSVYRTYRTGDNLELYVERKVGVFDTEPEPTPNEVPSV